MTAVNLTPRLFPLSNLAVAAYSLSFVSMSTSILSITMKTIIKTTLMMICKMLKEMNHSQMEKRILNKYWKLLMTNGAKPALIKT